MARKSKRRLGHITSRERFDVSAALTNAESLCYGQYPADSDAFAGCVKGVRFATGELKKKGFEPFR